MYKSHNINKSNTVTIHKINYIHVYVLMGARRGGQEGALAPPWKFTDMGAPPRII